MMVPGENKLKWIQQIFIMRKFVKIFIFVSEHKSCSCHFDQNLPFTKEAV